MSILHARPASTLPTPSHIPFESYGIHKPSFSGAPHCESDLQLALSA